jgi:hypothetical protein
MASSGLLDKYVEGADTKDVEKKHAEKIKNLNKLAPDEKAKTISPKRMAKIEKEAAKIVKEEENKRAETTGETTANEADVKEMEKNVAKAVVEIQKQLAERRIVVFSTTNCPSCKEL